MAAAEAGPRVVACPSVHASELPRTSDGSLQLWLLAAGRHEPLVVRGAFSDSVAAQRWTFAELAGRCAAADASGKGGLQSAQNGLIEQGATRPPQAVLPSEYLRTLSRDEAATPPAAGLLPVGGGADAATAPVSLDWAAIGTRDKQYLAHWDMFGYLPACKREGAAIAAARRQQAAALTTEAAASSPAPADANGAADPAGPNFLGRLERQIAAENEGSE